MVIKEVKEHLIKHILPFWMGLKDDVYGGFYGEMGYDGKVKYTSVKGCIYHSRILWFFSNASSRGHIRLCKWISEKSSKNRLP